MNYKYRLLLLVSITLLAVACLVLGFRHGLILLVMMGLIVELLVWLAKWEADFAIEVAQPARKPAAKK